MNYDFINLAKSQLHERGWAGPFGFFNKDELQPLFEKIINKYSKFFDFNENSTSLEKLENSRVLVDHNLIKKEILIEDIIEFSKKEKINSIFSQIFESKNIKLTDFIDFRLNYSGDIVPQSTGWHQDIETFYTHSFEGFDKKSLAMWVSLTNSDESNSLEFLNGSHKSKTIYNTTYTNKKKSIDEIVKNVSKDKISNFKSKPGDIVLIDPYVLHRSIVKNSSFHRMSIDIRFLDNDSIVNNKFEGNNIIILKFLRHIKNKIKSLIKI